jgi:hypothetical protein
LGASENLVSSEGYGLTKHGDFDQVRLVVIVYDGEGFNAQQKGIGPGEDERVLI